jgi:hypothetical protein
VRVLDMIDRIKQIGFPRSGTRAPHVNACYGALLIEDDSAAGRPAGVGEVAHLDSLDVSDESLGLRHLNRMLN